MKSIYTLFTAVFALIALSSLSKASSLADVCLKSVNTCGAQCSLAGSCGFNATCSGEINSCHCSWSEALLTDNKDFCDVQKTACENLCGPNSGAPNGTKIDSFTCDRTSGSSWCQCALDWTQWDNVRSYHANALSCANQTQTCLNTVCANKSKARAYCTDTNTLVCDCDGHSMIPTDNNSTFIDNVTFPLSNDTNNNRNSTSSAFSAAPLASSLFTLLIAGTTLAVF